MNRRGHRDFDRLSEAQMLMGLTASRRVDALVLVRPPSSKSIADLLDTIQHVTEAATGERSFLHLKPRVR